MCNIVCLEACNFNAVTEDSIHIKSNPFSELTAERNWYFFLHMHSIFSLSMHSHICCVFLLSPSTALLPMCEWIQGEEMMQVHSSIALFFSSVHLHDFKQTTPKYERLHFRPNKLNRNIAIEIENFPLKSVRMNCLKSF